MPRHPLIEDWTRVFGQVAPTGFICRKAMPDRWLRVHSLPDSKRYPETDEETAEILRRHNEVATYSLSDGADCTMFAGNFGAPRHSEGAEFVARELHLEYVQSIELDGDPLALSAARVRWHSGAFDELISAVANDRAGFVLFANLEHGTIYAPYDGGADLFLASHTDVSLARNRFREWLSYRSDGM